MKISVFLNSDLASNIALNSLLPTLQKHQFNLYLSEKVGGNKKLLPQLEYLHYLEHEFLDNNLFPLIDSESLDGFQSFQKIAREYDTSLNVLQEVTKDSTVSLIKSFQPELFLSIRFGKIFKGEILTIPSKGIINLHSAILPDYRGVLGTLRAFQHKEKEIGYTIHVIHDHTIDTGSIIHLERMAVISGKSILWHLIHLYPDASLKLSGLIGRIHTGELIDAKPPEKGGNYFSFPGKEDIEEVERNGIQLYNHDEYAEILHHFYKVDKTWVQKKLKEMYRSTV